MNRSIVGHLFGILMMIEAALLTVPMLTALVYRESILPFLITMGILVAVALPLLLIRPKDRRIYRRDGYICVVGSWILLSLFGALPFVISGVIPNYINAFFETVSGFTTTGATVMTSVEGNPKGVLLWRCFTHWIGGMGVLVFMIALFPSENGQAIHLMRAETTGPTKGKLVPKVRQSAIILYLLYFGLTVLQVVLLCIAKLPFYDALVTSFSTAGTGGFSVMDASIAGYHNPTVEWIVSVFMLLFGINFNLYFFLLIGKVKDVCKNEELRTYLAICAVSVTLILINTWHTCASAGKCLRDAVFQVATVISTTGFATVDYDALWPDFSKTVLLLLMLIGSCAGSTAGGLKVSRVSLTVKSMLREIKHIIRPNSVNVVRFDGEVIPTETLHRVSNYMVLYFSLTVATVFLLSVDGFGLETNMTATLACINNIGPGLGKVGPTGNFSEFSWFSKLLLSLDMLLGRLELLPVLIFFSPTAWRKR